MPSSPLSTDDLQVWPLLGISWEFRCRQVTLDVSTADSDNIKVWRLPFSRLCAYSANMECNARQFRALRLHSAFHAEFVQRASYHARMEVKKRLSLVHDSGCVSATLQARSLDGREGVIAEDEDAAVVGLEVVDLLAEHHHPQVLAHELHALEVVLQPRHVARVPLGQHPAHAEALPIQPLQHPLAQLFRVHHRRAPAHPAHAEALVHEFVLLLLCEVLPLPIGGGFAFVAVHEFAEFDAVRHRHELDEKEVKAGAI